MSFATALFIPNKHALATVFVLIGLCEASWAGGSREALTIQDDSITQSIESESPDANLPQNLDESISIEDRIRLRRDLDEYSRSVDTAHVQIEERRRMMRKRVQERFMGSDKDSDGSISREEAVETLPQVARHFSQFDLNSDGVITLNELEEAQTKIAERQRGMIAKDDAQESDVTKRKGKSNAKEAAVIRKRSL